MNTLQNPLRTLPTNVGQLMPLDPMLPVPGSPDGGFADLLRNFDAEPTPDAKASQPTPTAPAPAPAPAVAAPQQRPAKTAVQQGEGADAAAEGATRLDTDPGPDGPTETGPVQATGELDGEPTCTLHETRDPAADLPGTDPATTTRRLRPMPAAQKLKTEAADAETRTPTDASAAAGLMQAQQTRTPATDKSTDIRQPSTDLPPKTVAEAQARASDRAQGQQQADRQAQVQATQAAPLDAPTAAVQSFAAELKNSMPAAFSSPRAGATGISGLASAGNLAASNASGSAEEAPAPTAVNMPEPLDDAGFAGALGARLAILAKDGVQKAELHLNPADMGPVAVQITVDGQQAQVTFHAAQADTRGVLEQGLPDLAAALAANGLTLSGGGVFQQQQGRQGQAEGFAASGDRSANGVRAADGSSALPQAMPVGTRQRGVVDLYA